MKLSFRTVVFLAALAVLDGSSTAAAQDHEKCYLIRDPARIRGFVDLTTPQFGLEPGCRVSGAKYFCAPAFKSNEIVSSGGVPIVPLPLYAPPATVDRICYKIRCPIPPPPFPPDQNVTDQFGNRTLTRFKAAFVCTPAVKGPGFCGDGIIDPGEDCDGAATGACPGTCEADCTCTCATTCCYVENIAAPPDTECFEYSGTPAQVLAFETQCLNGLAPPAVGVPGSAPVVAMLNSSVGLGPCVAGPIFGAPCIPGLPGVGNLHRIPPDSSCP